ncbi:MAG: sulfotransferase [Anaerolineae bacterium]
MSINFSPAAVRSDLDPLIVTAPVIRSGTTLLQRLLCSSRTTLIYGELAAQDLEFFLNLYMVRVQEYSYNRRVHTRNLEQALTGNVNDWIPDLMPDIDEYLAALGRAAFAGVAYCRDCALRLGRPVWGFKYPGWKPPFIRLVRTLMPRARFIAITRELGACVRSAKAQRPFDSLFEAQDFCRAWAEGMDYWRGAGGDPAALVLSYEELTAAPAATLHRLAAFAGVDDIKPEVLGRKINAWTGGGPAQAHNGYAPPAELTGAEQQLVDETTSALQARAPV